MADEAAAKARRKARSARRHARLAAVQALYQIDLVKTDVSQAIDEIVSRERQDPRFDQEYFAALVRGASEKIAYLDALVGDTLSDDWPMDRLSVTMRALLRAAAFELETQDDVPSRVVISEYVDVARGFFDAAETGFANGVLDRLARQLRPQEWAGEGE